MSEHPAEAASEAKEARVVFHDSQGIELQGLVLRLTRFVAVFEIVESNAVLRTSEVLEQFRIVIEDQTVYSGGAVVRTLVNTGLKAIHEVTLGEGWLDSGLAAAPADGPRLRGEFMGFLQQWKEVYQVLPEYKVAVADLQSFLTDLRFWLGQVETGIGSAASAERVKLERQAAHELQEVASGSIRTLFERYEEVAARVGEELQPVHRAFARRQLHPLLLSAPFVYRAFRKPLGLAGDYEMVNMMFRDGCEGGSLFAKLVNVYALGLPPFVGHRNRNAQVLDHLQAETLRAAARGDTLRVYDVGCGPAIEIQEFLSKSDLCERARFTLVDFNDETLEHVSQALSLAKRRYGRGTLIETMKKSVPLVVAEAACASHQPGCRYDFVYCAGLFDYLPDAVCRQLIEVFYDVVLPGGLILITQVRNHPTREELEGLLEWHLIYRESDQLRRLVPNHIPPDGVTLRCDASGAILLMEVRKAQSAES